MHHWQNNFRYDPIAPLIAFKDRAVSLYAQKDLLNKPLSLQELWQLPEPQKILRKQKENGSWQYPGAKEHIRTQENYNQLETYRNLGVLVEMYGFTKEHAAIEHAAEYLFTFQTKEGDLRGIYGHQYSPNYTAGIAELLIKAGYGQDKRIKKVFEWLTSIRQSDGGWAIPLRTRNSNLKVISSSAETIQPDAAKPFSHMVTGVVLRAFAAHSSYKKSAVAKEAGWLLLSALFKKDNYADRAGQEYWMQFTFPFWFTDLISALDSLSQLGFSSQEPEIEKALHWLVAQQKKNGMWDLRITKGQNKDVTQAWLVLAICRIFKRFYG